MNLKKIMGDSPLDEQERLLTLLAVATSLHDEKLQAYAAQELAALGLAPENIQEAREAAAIMGMLNTYYKFRGFLDESTKDLYARAGLRMQSLAKPVNGKDRFEMMALAVSTVNGCPTCIVSHEKVLRDSGVDAEKIHDLARMASICKGLASLH